VGLLLCRRTRDAGSGSPCPRRRGAHEEWLRDLPDGNWAVSRLPSAVLAVAARAARSATGTDDPAEVAVARVLTRSGRWVVLHGVPLAAVESQRVAVIVEAAHPSRIAPLLMSAYGLTERAQELTSLVLQGFSTIDSADRAVPTRSCYQELLCPLRAAPSRQRTAHSRE
jgi:hypothetical protein